MPTSYPLAGDYNQTYFLKNLWVQRKSFVEDFSKVAFINSLREQITGQRLDLGIMRKLEPRHGQL